MMRDDNLIFASATEQAAAIRDGEISSVELLDAHLEQIDRHNDSLNAIVTLDAERVRESAQRADIALARAVEWPPLHGVPVTIKDVIATKGIRTTAGHEPLRDYVPDTDAPVVARLKAAGAIIIGKTNLPELCRDYQTDNPIFGRSNNPWNLDRTPGGSTGGGAAAVAAGLSPLEIGTDVGGSVRHPAHCCGIFSLKTTEYCAPLTGILNGVPESPQGLRLMNTIGPLARSLDDLDLAVRLISGPDGVDATVPPVPLTPVATPDLSTLRLAWTSDVDGAPVSVDTRRGLERLAFDLANAGARVESVLPVKLSFETLWELHGALIQAKRFSTLSDDEADRILEDDSLDPASENPLERGMSMMSTTSMRRYAEFVQLRDLQIHYLERFFDDWDALLTPAVATPAFTHRPAGASIEIDERSVPYYLGNGAYLGPFNVTGHPAVVAPLSQSIEGLPIGLQIIGPRWAETKILAIARAILPLVQGFRRPPGY